MLELVSKLLSAAIGCKARGTALSAKRGLDVLQYASEPFPPPALPTNFSLDLASKSVLKPVLGTLRRAVRILLFNDLVVAHAVCLLLCFASPVQAQEGKPLLRWKNGDALMGRLLESESGQIRWSSPIFAEELLVDIEALDSIVFPKRIVQTSGAFRVGTTSGTVITGDLVGSDESAYLFSSTRFGQMRIDRHAVISLDRIVSPNLTFDGSQFSEWFHLNDGPIKNLICKIYKGNWRWGAPFPDLSDLTPAEEIGLSAGYFDLGLSRFRERFAVSFEGQV